jgi:serine phosphatase RsbU (regulator of sigma subunit)
LGGIFDRLPRILRRLALGALFFAGGCLGWLIGGWLNRSVLGIRYMDTPFGVAVAVVTMGTVAVVVGTLFTVYDAMRSRLERSIRELKEREFAQKELEIAADIQRRLLPDPEIVGDGFAIAARHIPASYVAGDFYDVFRLPGGRLAVVAADVVGKGVGASLIMASVKAMIPLVAVDGSPADTLRELNRRLHQDLGPREFVALAVAWFDPSTGRVEIANAGLPDPYLVTGGAPPREIVVPGPRLPLGIREDCPYRTAELQLDVGHRLLLLTDGIPETAVTAGKPLGYQALASLLERETASPVAWLDALVADVRGLTAAEPEDDWTLVLLERTGDGRVETLRGRE